MRENIELQKRAEEVSGNFCINQSRKIQLFSGISGYTVRGCEIELYSKIKPSLKKFSPVLGGLRNVVISCKQRYYSVSVHALTNGGTSCDMKITFVFD